MTGFGVVVVVNRWHKRDSQDNEAVLYDSIVVATQHDTFVKTHRTQNTNRESSCKLRTLGDSDLFVQNHPS